MRALDKALEYLASESTTDVGGNMCRSIRISQIMLLIRNCRKDLPTSEIVVH